MADEIKIFSISCPQSIHDVYHQGRVFSASKMAICQAVCCRVSVAGDSRQDARPAQHIQIEPYVVWLRISSQSGGNAQTNTAV